MHISATHAKNRFGQMLDACQTEPVFIDKSGRPHGVLVSMQTYVNLQARGKASERPRALDVSQAFYLEHKAWIDHHNTLFDTHGVWSDGLLDAPAETGGLGGAADGSI